MYEKCENGHACKTYVYMGPILPQSQYYVCIKYAITYVHTYVHTYIHTYIHTYVHTCENVGPNLPPKSPITPQGANWVVLYGGVKAYMSPE
jgi:hypothetical protein